MYLCKSYISGLNGYVFLNVFAVEAYVASWIEIPFYFYTAYLQDRRGLCSLVDWNMDIKWYIELIYNIILDGKTDENMDWNIEYMLRKEMAIAKYIRSIFHNL